MAKPEATIGSALAQFGDPGFAKLHGFDCIIYAPYRNDLLRLYFRRKVLMRHVPGWR